MAVSETAILRKIKGANIFVDCTVPDSYTPPTLAAGVPAGGTDVGATIGESIFNYNATIELVDVEQSAAKIAPHVTEEAISMTFSMAEVDVDNLVFHLGQTFSYVEGDFSVMPLGGYIDVTGHCVACVAEKANDPGKYYGGMIYSAYTDGDRAVRHKRGEVSPVEVTLMGIALLSRDAGDQLGQYFEMT